MLHRVIVLSNVLELLILDGYGYCYSILRTAPMKRKSCSTCSRRSAAWTCGGCRWFLVLLMLATSSWVPAYSTRGLKVPTRDPAEIRGAPISVVTQERRSRLMGTFLEWLPSQTPLGLGELCRDLPLLSDVVRSFGWAAFDAGWPKNDYKDVILGIADTSPWARPGLTAAWRVVARWNQLEPSTPHTPHPIDLFRGACTVLAAWGWTRVLTLLWIGFFGLLRPGEVCEIRGSDILILSGWQGKGLLVRIGRPKRRVGGAKQEYARLDEEDVHPLVIAVLRKLPSGERLWPSSPKALGLRLQRALGQLVPQPERFTLGSLRSGGATHLFQRWAEDVPHLQWRGRWRVATTLAHYIQELSAVAVGLNWSPRVLNRISWASDLMADALADLLGEFDQQDHFLLGTQISAWVRAVDDPAADRAHRRRH